MCWGEFEKIPDTHTYTVEQFTLFICNLTHADAEPWAMQANAFDAWCWSANCAIVAAFDIRCWCILSNACLLSSFALLGMTWNGHGICYNVTDADIGCNERHPSQGSHNSTEVPHRDSWVQWKTYYIRHTMISLHKNLSQGTERIWERGRREKIGNTTYLLTYLYANWLNKEANDTFANIGFIINAWFHAPWRLACLVLCSRS